jgi:hypothetical protein
MKDQKTQLWFAQVGLAIGALALHYRIHPPGSLTFFWPTFFSGVDLIVVSILFWYRSTALYALLLKSFIAFIGIIMMADFSIHMAITGGIKVSFVHAPLAFLLQTLFADIAILFASFMVGLGLYKATMAK